VKKCISTVSNLQTEWCKLSKNLKKLENESDLETYSSSFDIGNAPGHLHLKLGAKDNKKASVFLNVLIFLD
jgi:hypothetical protein